MNTSLNSTASNEAPSKAATAAECYVLMKRGLFYRPKGNGYTNNIDEAWLVTEAEASKHVYPHDEPVTKHLATSFPSALRDLKAELAAAHKLLGEAHREAYRLADVMFKRHYAHAAHYESGEVKFGLCDSVVGIISQIDNMHAGVAEQLAQSQALNARLAAALSTALTAVGVTIIHTAEADISHRLSIIERDISTALAELRAEPSATNPAGGNAVGGAS